MELHGDVSGIFAGTFHEGALQGAVATVGAADGAMIFGTAAIGNRSHTAGICAAVEIGDGGRTRARGEVPVLGIIAKGDVGTAICDICRHVA